MDHDDGVLTVSTEIIIFLISPIKTPGLKYAHHIACPDTEKEHFFAVENRCKLAFIDREDNLALGQERGFKGHGWLAIFKGEGVRIKGVEDAVTLFLEGWAQDGI
jgi:hypothetical protein